MISVTTRKNLKLKSAALGPVAIQPRRAAAEDQSEVQTICIPHKMNEEEFHAVIEWASNTQTPIFCQAADVKRLEAEGFGTYRFQPLKAFRDVDFQGGRIEFYPTRRERIRGVLGFIDDIAASLNLTQSSSHHILFRPKNEGSVLFLSSPYIEADEWEVFAKAKPKVIVGSMRFAPHEWALLSTKIKQKIVSAAENFEIESMSEGVIQAKESVWVDTSKTSDLSSSS